MVRKKLWYTARLLPPAELNYSQIEKDGLANATYTH